ncbi:MAG: hypothetical protein M3Y84_10250 [Acidobacteriota bacterium]|nr:hypothetical protein [Acidobacteriota bacterium]
MLSEEGQTSPSGRILRLEIEDVAVAAEAVSWALQVVLFFKTAASDTTDKQEDEIRACEVRADAKLQNCIGSALSLVFPLNVAAYDRCFGQQVI